MMEEQPRVTRVTSFYGRKVVLGWDCKTIRTQYRRHTVCHSAHCHPPCNYSSKRSNIIPPTGELPTGSSFLAPEELLVSSLLLLLLHYCSYKDCKPCQSIIISHPSDFFGANTRWMSDGQQLLKIALASD